MKRFLLKVIKWDPEKNKKLKNDTTRQICFEDVFLALQENNFYYIDKHYNSEKYPNQKILFIEINNYIYIVPFVENDEEIFLKTIIPSRKYTKKFLKDKAQK